MHILILSNCQSHIQAEAGDKIAEEETGGGRGRMAVGEGGTIEVETGVDSGDPSQWEKDCPFNLACAQGSGAQWLPHLGSTNQGVWHKAHLPQDSS